MLSDNTPEPTDYYQVWQLIKYGNIITEPTNMFQAEPSERLSIAEDNYIYSLLQPPY